MMKKVALALGFAGTVTGQLLAPTQEELTKKVGEHYKQEVQDLVNQKPKEDTPANVGSSGFTHPTICDPSVKQTAGRLPASLLSEYFFWLFESKGEPSKDPLIIWLSGGPGCSSSLALFAENGPCKVKKDGSGTETNPHSWHTNANVMWIDQPSGVGFSSGLDVFNEAGVARNMLTFLGNFYDAFPSYLKQDLYIFGESYAGHYVPAIAHAIWKRNKAGATTKIPLAGLSIGNGLTDPQIQYEWYAKMGHDGGAPYGHAPKGVINDKEYLLMEALTLPCIAAIAACNYGIPGAAGVLNLTACITAYDVCNLMAIFPYKATGKNPYDMRIPCEHGNLCYDFDHIGTYLNTESIQQQLGVSKNWQSCNYVINLMFNVAGDWMVNYQKMLPELLEDGIRVLIYAGDCDYICNWLGNQAWTLALDWQHKDEFNKAPMKDYASGGETVARLRSSNGFSFMQVFNAGHMVPMDQPAVALQMVNDFLNNKIGGQEEKTEGSSADIVV